MSRLDPAHLSTSVYAYGNLDTSVSSALSIIEAALDRHGTDSVAISYNGGKDCTVLLHLYAAVLIKRLNVTDSDVFPLINAMYIPLPNEFPLLQEFIQASVNRYNLQLFESPATCTIRTGLQAYKESTQGSAVKAILIGTRGTDPDGLGLEEISHTSGGWPSFERVSPILRWSYTDVWRFLREPSLRVSNIQVDQPGVPYCRLYDMG